ncbi:apolipoprotein N-acyltransferase [Ruegeria marina]|uniref:Apolipoprotein N-acyltransferase n=1 Tax=Ruegeria marina TaxID=639004 RepID=A0A1G6UER3_9RHOB|nr:apolipoprotein N-acyltransferase [Ruegeria marina]SDD39087.1 Apolipoprotein N-acyltransferase [Ruegeria marina]
MTFLSGWRLWQRMALAAALGVIAALGLAPTSIWVATIAALLTVPALFQAARSRGQAAWTGWAFATGYFGHALVWIVEPFMVDVARHGWMAPFALGLIAGGLALFWAAAFALAAMPWRGAEQRILLLALALGVAECARGYVFSGFPWAGLAQIWVGTDASLLLAWSGPNGLALITLLVALLPGAALALGRGGAALLLRCLPAVAFGLAIAAADSGRPDIAMSGKTVRLVQPNAPQHQKWDPDWYPVFLERKIEFTGAGPRPDMVVWPESALPYWLERAGPVLQEIADAARGAPVVIGANRASGPRIFNSMAVLGPGGDVDQVYDKHHLVPFGEYVPFGDLLERIGISGFASRDGQGFSSGPGPAVIRIAGIGAALPLICYEAVFPQDVNGAPDRPDFLLQLTNDAWFGTWSGPYQHLAQARMRAIEQGLPMVRVANTGVSAMIDPLGRITTAIPLNQAGYADAELPLPLAPTAYSQTGDLPVVLAMLVLLIGVARIPVRPAAINSD